MPDSKGDRDRSPRRNRSGRSESRRSARRAPPERRIFISNIPFEMKWQEVKDMFREKVGDVTYVELFNDEDDKPRGCGILEFDTCEMAKNAVDKMHRYELKGRKLVVKEDFENERDKFGRIIRVRGGPVSGNDRGDRDRDRGDRRDNRGGGGGGGIDYGNTYGLSPQFLDSLGINTPLHTRLFVANLSYSVDERKLREVFRLAGRVVSTELNRDKEGKSRGHGVVEFSHPVEAVQAISMFNEQGLFDRKMTVRFDKDPGPTPEELDQLPSRLPDGLSSVGMGLGSGGNPLTNVASNLPSAQNNANNMGNLGNIADLASTVGSIQAVLARQLGMNNMGGGGGVGGASNNMTMGGGGGGSLLGNPMGAPGMGQGVPQMGQSASMGIGSGMGMGGGGNNMGMGMNMGSSSMGQNSLMGGSGAASSMGLSSTSSMGGNPMNSMGGNASTSSMGYSSGTSTGGYNNSGVGARGNVSLDSGALSRAGVGGGMNLRNSDTVIVRNLPNDITWQDLREGFAQCGEIKYAEMKEKGTGLVRFTSERDAEAAVSMMDKQPIDGRPIDVRLY